MENSEINFCSECQNMTYLYIDENKDLIYHCKSCNKSEKCTLKNKCIYSVDFRKYDSSELIDYNKFISHDISLPRIEGNNNIKCINEECESVKGEKDSSFTYIKYDIDEMKYIYICNNCGQKWKNN